MKKVISALLVIGLLGISFAPAATTTKAQTLNNRQLTVVGGAAPAKTCAALGGWCIAGLWFPAAGLIGCLGFVGLCIDGD